MSDDVWTLDDIAHSERYEKEALDHDIDMSYQYLEEEIERAFEERSADAAGTYLGTFGDAITARVRGAIGEARTLLDTGHPGPALALAATAVELTVRDLIVKSTVQGAFLSSEWATILADQIVRDAPGEPRKLLPLMANAWGLDLNSIKLSGGAAAWGVFTGSVVPARNAFLHRGDPVEPDLALRSISVAEALLDGLGGALAAKVGLLWPEHPWHMARSFGRGVTKAHEPQDPYTKR
jgi:hypothetical protein